MAEAWRILGWASSRATNRGILPSLHALPLAPSHLPCAQSPGCQPVRSREGGLWRLRLCQSLPPAEGARRVVTQRREGPAEPQATDGNGSGGWCNTSRYVFFSCRHSSSRDRKRAYWRMSMLDGTNGSASRQRDSRRLSHRKRAHANAGGWVTKNRVLTPPGAAGKASLTACTTAVAQPFCACCRTAAARPH